MAGSNQQPASRTTPRPPDEFTTLETIRDPDGVVATITERKRDGRVSFSIARQYDSQGDAKETKWLSARHIPAVVRLLNDLGEKLELHEDRARARRR